jgi:hypothetical protein
MSIKTIIQGVTLLFKAKKPLTDLADEFKTVKSNWKSPAFWFIVLGTFGTLAALVQGIVPAMTSLIITTTLGVLYNVGKAVEDAQKPGVNPPLTSTKFWVGILAIVSAGLIQLKSGGLQAEWVTSAIALIGSIMAAAQAVGANQPAPQDPPNA